MVEAEREMMLNLTTQHKLGILSKGLSHNSQSPAPKLLLEGIQGGLFMLEHFFKSLVATVSDPYQCNRITDALAAAGIKFYCKSKDVNRHNTFDQARIGTLGIKPRYVTEVFVDKENADMALHIIHTLS